MHPDLFLGLQISLAGLAVTFLVLGLLTLIIRLLRWLFPAGSQRLEKAGPQTGEMDEQQRQETAAALAVAVSLLEQHAAQPEQDPALGKLLEP
jgi:Na+-transporting methylmalonyl-CoA/oxaloacetate decarboxylase gamma subunit